MFHIDKSGDREKNYQTMASGIKGVLQNETDEIARLAMASSIIYAYMDEINWSGFYILKNGILVLGPFQGHPACVRIKLGNGVCGTAAAEKRTLIVEDVDEFPGHIACDSASRSEIVLPIFKNDELFGVLDIDSPTLGRFGVLENKYLSQISNELSKAIART